MSAVVLNLSRKWRSQDFNQIVGQDLVVRVLKNSLYLGHYFPVYLYAGQRGCGKTSTARIFAAAVNCSALPLFEKNPKNSSIPCLVCESCIAMREGNHPDFIEIDAASHTGVDNIRNIIESSSLLPTIGRKRVYLIDEAHMLSKAAFNAALKILEEPPATALFILATTNPHKIIDTVRSRCFQLFFTSISHEALKNHLTFICKQEKIIHTDNALDLIVRHTEGSARDALNLLEQVRFSSSMVNEEAVLCLLGHIDDQYIIKLIHLTMHGEVKELVQLLHSLNIDNNKAEFIWQRMIILLRSLLWIKYDVQPQEIIASIKLLENAARWCTLADLHRMIEALYINEELFLRTPNRYIFLEMVLFGLCFKDKKKIDDGNGSAPQVLDIVINNEHDISNHTIEDKASDKDYVINYDQQWQQFVKNVESLNDPLLYSIFKQAKFISYELDKRQIFVELSKDFILFQEWLEGSRATWQLLLRKVFAVEVILNIQFTGTQKVEVSNKKQKNDSNSPAELVSASIVQQSKEKQVPSKTPDYSYANRYNAKPANNFGTALYKSESRVDVSDANVWQNASVLLRHFPGVITEMREK